MRVRVTLVPAALTATVLAAAGHAAAHDAPVVTVVNTVEVDDPMEDVLEHTLNFGDGYNWDWTPARPGNPAPPGHAPARVRACAVPAPLGSACQPT
jgi:hypothetical protein